MSQPRDMVSRQNGNLRYPGQSEVKVVLAVVPGL